MPNGEEQCNFCMKEQLIAKKSITRKPMAKKLPKAERCDQFNYPKDRV